MARGCVLKCVGTKGDVSWKLKYDAGKDPVTGKRIQAYETVHGTKKEAENRLNEIQAELGKGSHLLRKQDVTLKDWSAMWLKSKQSRISTKTRERYEELLTHHVIPRLGACTLLELQRTPTLIEAHYDFLRLEGKKPAHRAWKDPDSAPKPDTLEKRGLSEKSVLHVHRALSQALSKAVRDKKIVQNPCDLIDSPRSASAKEDMTIIDRGQNGALMKGLNGHPLYHIVGLALGTGARRGELLALTWKDIDFEKGTIRINKSLEEVRVLKPDGKGKTLTLQVGEPKTRSSRRVIGIDPELLKRLKSVWAEHAETALRLGFRLPPDALVFPRTPAEPRLHVRPDYVTKAFPKEAERLGFPDMRFHDLRHSHIVQLLLDGAPLKAVSARAGHASSKMTLDTYDHVLPRSEEKLLAVAGSIMAEAFAH